MKDLLFTAEGDLFLETIDEEYGGVLGVGDEEELIDQIVFAAIRSSNPEWFNETFPADLENLIGKSNTRETAESGKNQIKTSLLKTKIVREEDLWIEAKPTSENEISFFVLIRDQENESERAYVVNSNLEHGADIKKVK